MFEVRLKRKKDEVAGVENKKKSKSKHGSEAIDSCVDASLVSAKVAGQPRRVQ